MKKYLLSDEDFLKTFENAPRAAANLIVKDREGRVLLTRRNIPPDRGRWHIPGGFILKNERVEDCLKRVAKKELGLDLDESPQVLGVFDDLDKDERGHVIDIAYGVTIDDTTKLQTTDETAEIKFFEKLPEDIGFNHRDTLHKLGYKDED